MRVLIIVEGGVVQEVFVSDPTIAVEIIDHDNLEAKGHSRLSRASIEREACAGLSDANVREILDIRIDAA